MTLGGQKSSVYRPLAALLVLTLLLGGCAPANVPAVETPRYIQTVPSIESLEERAGAQATAIIESALATAMVMEAEAEAAEILQEAQAGKPNAPQAAVTAVPTVVAAAQVETQKDASGGAGESGDEDESAGNDDEYWVALQGVGFAAEGGFIMVGFRASLSAVNDFWPGRLSVTDEASGTVYNEVPTMPVIGPLIGRPKTREQNGYVMLVNTYPGLPPGALVTVQLGQFVQEHVVVQAAEPGANPTPQP